ncbi:MAG TPA: hypothetical protein VFM27_21245 [Acidimicrobiales bacterium]|nr:hypothetical protein [Acidimicrobiales bacterium]
MADIEIVAPSEGAATVDFDFGAAGAALDALAKMSSKLGEQSTARQTLATDVVVDWLGYFRTEYDRAFGLLQSRFTAGAELAGYAALPIWTAIGNANEEQRRLNQAAEQARLAQTAAE